MKCIHHAYSMDFETKSTVTEAIKDICEVDYDAERELVNVSCGLKGSKAAVVTYPTNHVLKDDPL